MLLNYIYEDTTYPIDFWTNSFNSDLNSHFHIYSSFIYEFIYLSNIISDYNKQNTLLIPNVSNNATLLILYLSRYFKSQK